MQKNIGIKLESFYIFLDFSRIINIIFQILKILICKSYEFFLSMPWVDLLGSFSWGHSLIVTSEQLHSPATRIPPQGRAISWTAPWGIAIIKMLLLLLLLLHAEIFFNQLIWLLLYQLRWLGVLLCVCP